MAQASCYDSTSYAISQTSAGDTLVNAKTGRTLFLDVNNGQVAALTATLFTVSQPFLVSSQTATITQGAVSGTPRVSFTVTPVAATLLTSTTESPQVKLNFARTQQWATSPPVTQREFLIDRPTYSCDTVAQTITTAATVAIVGAPAPGTNVTITTPLALWVQAGDVKFDGTTDGTSGTAGAISTLGGGGFTKAVWAGTNLTWANGVGSGTITDAVTNTTTSLLTLQHNSSGTVANGFGSRLLFNLQDDTTANQNAASITTTWTTAATATRTSNLVFNTVSSGAALAASLTLTPTTATFPQAVQVTFNGFSSVAITQTAAAGGTRNCLVITPAANLTVTSGTEDPQVIFAFDRVQTWNTTTPATQREFKINQPTYACNAISQTITDGATLAIVGGPIAGTNVTITNKHALWAQAGYITLPGNSGNSLRITSPTANGAVVVTVTGVGPTGAQTTIQGWMIVNVNGTDRFMPFW